MVALEKKIQEALKEILIEEIWKHLKTKNNLTYAGIAVINPKIFKGFKEDY